MQTLEKISNLVPASFENPKDRLSLAQVALLDLLKDSVAKNSSITSHIIVNLYIKHVKQSETYQQSKWSYKDGTYGHFGEMETKFYRNNYLIKSQAKQWFKNNLGAVIMKGKVLIIPIIED